MNMKRISILTFIVFLLAGCQSRAQLPGTDHQPTPDYAQMPAEATISSTPAATPGHPPDSVSPVLTPEPETTLDQDPLYPLTHYEIQAVLDFDWNSVSVDQTITYTNSAGESIETLLLVVEPNRRYGSFRLNRLAWGDGQVIDDYQMELHRLSIPLPQPLLPGDSILLEISYILNLPEIPAPSAVDRPLPFGFSQRQTNLVDWYPYIPPYYSGQGWAVHNPWFFGEHQVYELADYDVEIQLESALQNLTLAASALAESDGNTYRYQMKSARSFALSASNMYTTLSQQVGDVTVYGYAFTFDTLAGERAFKDTVAALELYSKLFGPYPHASLSVVEADFLDGMEYDGLFFLSRGFYSLYDGTPLGYLTAIAVHETAHQWWYGMVGNNQALEPWLDEALCTYAELLYYENLYPDLVDGWWDFRVNYQQPSGFIDGAIYDYNGFVSYRDATYLRGAQFLHALRGMLGEDSFFSFLQDYLSRSREQPYGLATTQDFFMILQEHTTVELDELMGEFFKTYPVR